MSNTYYTVNNADGVTIIGAKVWNQDDCVAVNSGSNIYFGSGFCSGGHGLSIGSIGGQNVNVVTNGRFVSFCPFSSDFNNLQVLETSCLG